MKAEDQGEPKTGIPTMLTKAQADASAPAAELRLEPQSEGGLEVAFLGDWTTRSVSLVDRQMRDLEQRAIAGTMTLNLAGIEKLDTAGAWLIQRLVAAQRKAGTQIAAHGHSAGTATLLEAVAPAAEADGLPPLPALSWSPVVAVEALGRTMVDIWRDFLLMMNLLGATISGPRLKAGRGKGLRPVAIVHQMERIGIGAIPVVVMMSTIIGAIIAQQGAFQLRYFGAEIFVVDLVGILVLREIGVLLTAIMIAGRSGSAITAEIGSMKMREEVDALTVIGLNPVGVLVFPRLVALILMLPCLVIVANAAALGGAIFVAWFYSDIQPAAFIERLRFGIGVNTIMAGLIKAPFMALIIGIIAAAEGMKVGGSAESLGRRVTASVVKAIFIVIVVDGLFAMFYAAIDF